MIVVSDTSAISNLLSIGCFGLLGELFGQVVIPSAVASELLRWHDEVPLSLIIKEPKNPELPVKWRGQLDPGETAAISLSLELQADLLLIDERKGRLAANELGLRTTGLLGVLLESKRAGLVDRVGPLLDALISQAGFRVSIAVREEFLLLAGEGE